MIDNVENLYFNITIDYYRNKIYVNSLSDNYTNVGIVVWRWNKDSVLYSTDVEFTKNGFIWVELFDKFSNLFGIVVDVVNENGVIVSEKFRFKSDTGIPIKPLSIHIWQQLGLGDVIQVTPLIRKLYNIYEQKVTVIGVEKYRDIFKNNRYVNKFIDKFTEGDFIEGDIDTLYENFTIFENWYEFRWMDARQIAAKEAQITLRDDELEYDFIPDKFIPVELPENYVCLYPYKTGIDRDMGQEKYQELVNLLNDNDIPVVMLGHKKPSGEKDYHELNVRLGLNLSGEDIQNNFSQKWHIIHRAKIFISFVSSIYMLASSTDTYILQLGWYSDPYNQEPVRNKIRNYKYSYLLGECEIHCMSNQNYDVKLLGSIKDKYQREVQKCILNINFTCKPEPKRILDEVLKIYNS